MSEGTNDVYKGIARNSSLPESQKMTDSIELAQSQAIAKQLYDQTVAQKLSEGFTPRTDWIAAAKASAPYMTDVWEGQQSMSGQAFIVLYYYDGNVSPSWLFETQAQG
jgi:hypothetical protein